LQSHVQPLILRRLLGNPAGHPGRMSEFSRFNPAKMIAG
jgi:hypothetical protein